MKKQNLFYFCIAAILLSACTNAPKSDEAVTNEAKEIAATADGQSTAIDPAASKVEWIGTKVSGYHSGAISIKSGNLMIKEGSVTGGNFVLDMNSITVTGPAGSSEKGNTKLMGHLKSADFFEVEKFSEATFAITGVQPFSGGTITEVDDERQADISKYKVTDPTHTISGNLTIKGITKNIEFPSKITMNGNEVEAIAKFNIDRTQWNIIYPGQPDDLIRNEIHLGIAIKTIK